MSKQKGFSQKQKNITVILLFLSSLITGLIGPFIAVILMWKITDWKKGIKIFITTIYSVCLLLAILSIFNLFYFKPVQVKGRSMEPTYHNGTYLMTSLIPTNKSLTRDEVIIFKSPVNPNVENIKRVVGIPGDTIAMKNGYLYVNEKKFKDVRNISQNSFIRDNENVTIPENKYFVLGDNPEFSADSRTWGFVPREYIISKIEFCYRKCTN
ncbi:MAG TPA: signal peptidase I [Candidatus Nitrosocosmicus sp.]|nr:signal peptidase I [Candidatus Nitrosocosmicus sp.]